MNAAVSLDFDRRPSAVPYMVRGMLPVSRRPDLAPQISAHWHGHRASPADLAEFRRITGLPTEGTLLPLLYPHTFGFRLAMAILTHPRFPVPILGVLQTRNHLVQHRPIAIDEPLDFDATVMHGRVVPKGAEFDLRTTVHSRGSLVWQGVVTFYTRGRFGEPDPASPLTRSPSEFGPPAAAWTMRDANHWKFGRFTGDYNGIHMWDWYARRFAAGCPCRLELEAQSLGPQSVEPHSGGRWLANWSFGGEGVQTRAAELPALAPGQQLVLRLPGAHPTPADPRLLGLRLVAPRAVSLTATAPAR